MPGANKRRIRDVLANGVLAYGVLRNDPKHVMPLELDDDGNLLVDDLSRGVLNTLTVGDVTNGNYLEVKSDGEINLHGTARAWVAMELDPASILHPSANGPDEVAYQEIYFDAYDDSSEEQVFYIWHVPPDFAIGTGSVKGHFGGMVGNEAGDEYVAMGFEWWKFSPGDTYDISGAANGGGAVNITIVNGEGNYVWHESAEGTVDTTGWVAGDIIVFRFFRDVSGTYTGGNPPYADNYTGDAYLGAYHLEYLIDKLGEAA